MNSPDFDLSRLFLLLSIMLGIYAFFQPFYQAPVLDASISPYEIVRHFYDVGFTSDYFSNLLQIETPSHPYFKDIHFYTLIALPFYFVFLVFNALLRVFWLRLKIHHLLGLTLSVLLITLLCTLGFSYITDLDLTLFRISGRGFWLYFYMLLLQVSAYLIQ